MGIQRAFRGRPRSVNTTEAPGRKTLRVSGSRRATPATSRVLSPAAPPPGFTVIAADSFIDGVERGRFNGFSHRYRSARRYRLAGITISETVGLSLLAAACGDRSQIRTTAQRWIINDGVFVAAWDAPFRSSGVADLV